MLHYFLALVKKKKKKKKKKSFLARPNTLPQFQNPLLRSPQSLIHKTQQSSGSSCHQIHSVTSSPLSAAPVTLPALSLYPQASSITYQAGRSSGNDVTTSPPNNHSPTLSTASYAKHKDPGAALSMADRTQISQALGVLEYSILQCLKLAAKKKKGGKYTNHE